MVVNTVNIYKATQLYPHFDTLIAKSCYKFTISSPTPPHTTHTHTPPTHTLSVLLFQTHTHFFCQQNDITLFQLQVNVENQLQHDGIICDPVKDFIDQCRHNDSGTNYTACTIWCIVTHSEQRLKKKGKHHRGAREQFCSSAGVFEPANIYA